MMMQELFTHIIIGIITALVAGYFLMQGLSLMFPKLARLHGATFFGAALFIFGLMIFIRTLMCMPHMTS